MGLVTRVFALSATGIVVLTVAGVAAAQDKSKTPPTEAPERVPAVSAPAQPAANWAVSCENTGNGLECKASHVIVTAQTRQLVLAVTVSKPAGGKDSAMLIRLPHGLFNPAGVTLAIDDQKAEKIEIQTCDASGCYAGAPIPPERLAAMTSGTTLNIVFQDLKKQNIGIPVPLKGFEDAFKKL